MAAEKRVTCMKTAIYPVFLRSENGHNDNRSVRVNVCKLSKGKEAFEIAKLYYTNSPFEMYGNIR